MTLRELRQEWEENGKVVLTLTSSSRDVYTLVRGKLSHIKRNWHAFRYSMKGNTWEDSGIVASHFPSIDQCPDYLNREFKKFYPNH